MTFDDLLDRVWFFDFEVYKFNWLLVLINYRTQEEISFHNDTPNSVQEFIDKNDPILIGYNSRHYDMYILKGILAGFTNNELSKLNEYLINNGKGWEYNFGTYINTPPIWDLMQDIVPMKSLKEIEGHMGLDITETTVDFKSETKWTQQEYEEVLYYCEHDVNALIPLFEKRKDYYEAKFTICEMGNIPFEYGLGLTNANLTATFLKAERKEHNDKNDYKYPDNFETEKILPEVKKYFDSFINGEIDIDEQCLPIKIDETEGNVGAGGIHLAINNYFYVREDFNEDDYYE